MNLSTVGLIYRKEMRETLRDRRTLIVMLLLPMCLYPVLGIGLSQWIGVQEARRIEKSSNVAIVGAAWSPLEAALEGDKRLRLVRSKKSPGAAAVRAEELDLVLSIPADIEASLLSDETVELGLIFDESRQTSALARQRVEALLDRLSAQLRRGRLARRQLPASLFDPLSTRRIDMSSPGARGAKILSGFIPMLVILMVLLGAFYPAIDLTAGEKERGTLETLLVTPAARTSIITAKYLVVATISIGTGLLNLGSIGLTIVFGFGPALDKAGVVNQFPWSAVALIVLAMAMVSLFFAALMVAAASLARTFKEAQNLLTPIYIVCMLPALAAQMPGLELSTITALIPVVNISLLTRDLIAGQLQWFPAAVALVSILACAAVALKMAAKIFDSERMLFAPDPSLEKKRRKERTTRVPLPTPLQAGALLLVVMALIILVGARVQARGVITGILITEWLLIAAPVAALLWFGKIDHRRTLALVRPSVTALIGAALVGLSAWYLVGVVVEVVQQRWMPMPEEMVKSFQKAILAPDRSLALDLFALAISPALCEEALFRGVLLQTTRKTMSVRSVVLVNGILFGLFHLNIYRFFPTMALGMMLALVAIRTRSIWPGVLFHLLNNASAIIAGRLLGLADQGATTSVDPVGIAVTLVVFTLGTVLVMGPGRRMNSLHNSGD